MDSDILSSSKAILRALDQDLADEETPEGRETGLAIEGIDQATEGLDDILLPPIL
jgi:hypothetical protein